MTELLHNVIIEIGIHDGKPFMLVNCHKGAFIIKLSVAETRKTAAMLINAADMAPTPDPEKVQ